MVKESSSVKDKEEKDPSPDPSKGQEEKKEGADFWPGKFKTGEAAIESYKHLEEKLGEQGTELESLRNYYNDSYKVLQAVAADPELLGKVQKHLGVESSQKIEGETKGPGIEAGRLRKIVQDEIAPFEERERARVIADFEVKHGIDQLPEEERRQVRGKIGAELVSLTGQLPPVGRLASALEKAYKLVSTEKLEKSGDAKDRVTERQAQSAKIGGIPASSGKEKSLELTPEQRQVARRLGIKEDDYVKQLGRIQAEKP